MGKFYFETKIHTFFGKRPKKGDFLDFFGNGLFFDVKIINNVLILRKMNLGSKSLLLLLLLHIFFFFFGENGFHGFIKNQDFSSFFNRKN